MALGIIGGAEFAEKIFRPFPVYSTDSVTSIASICRDGSRAADVDNVFAALPEPAPVPAVPPGASGALVAAGAGFAEGVESPVANISS
jgi:hypothetical protein